MDIVAKLGKRLKMVRIAAGIKQKDLAVKLGIPAPLLSMYEKGSREPPLTFLNEFASTFKMPLSQLFSLLDEASAEPNNEIAAMMGDMKKLLLSLEKETLKGRNRE